RNQPLLALAPSLAFHALILNYTGEDALSLQIVVFAFILLVGINQTWSIAQEKSENSERAARETYSAVILVSITLAIIAGSMPSISAKEIAQKLTGKDALAKSIGLERGIAQAYAISGLPRQHLIGLSPRLSQMVIFTVKTGELEPNENAIINQAVPRHYWRWLTYDIYNGQGWATSPLKNVSYSPNQLLFSISSDGYQVIHQRVEKALPQDTRLYLTGFLASATEPFKASWRTTPGSQPVNIDPFPAADMLGAVTEKQNYQADSIIAVVSANLLQASSQLYPQEIRTGYLSLPETVPQRVRSLARELTINVTNPYDKAKAIETYLRKYPYTLDLSPPPPDRDIVDYFLFDLKKGYCDYYATSMIVLARAAGLPARLVIGYATGIYDPLKAEYVIHESDAHSWVEIYFAGAGWVEFEPTASQLQITLPDELPRESISPIIPFPIPSEDRVIAYTKGSFLRQRELFPLVTGLAFMVLFSCAWFLRTQGLFKSHATIGSIYEYIFYHGKKICPDAPTHETPSIFADKLMKRLRTGYSWLIPAPDEIKFLTDLYIQETFSPRPITGNERVQAVKVWRKLFWRLLYARAIRL
ncbi:MAG TPA: transglutaminase domain-containing protein, partial [Anaerolineales bacterium]|nr:transglutaminase domain-containing protein [Anaerolineales bacterium]